MHCSESSHHLSVHLFILIPTQQYRRDTSNLHTCRSTEFITWVPCRTMPPAGVPSNVTALLYSHMWCRMTTALLPACSTPFVKHVYFFRRWVGKCARRPLSLPSAPLACSPVRLSRTWHPQRRTSRQASLTTDPWPTRLLVSQPWTSGIEWFCLWLLLADVEIRTHWRRRAPPLSPPDRSSYNCKLQGGIPRTLSPATTTVHQLGALS